MKANELRIGNLFYPTNVSSNIHVIDEIPFIIMEVSQNEVRGYMNGKPIHQVLEYGTFSIRHVNPIPLTEEWLVKFGFEKYVKSSVCNGWSIGINPVTHDYLFDIVWMKSEKGELIDCFYRNGHFQLKHVHQLQNLYFALTGDELEIKHYK